MPPLLADFTHARPCKPFCEKYLTLPPDVKLIFTHKKEEPFWVPLFLCLASDLQQLLL